MEQYEFSKLFGDCCINHNRYYTYYWGIPKQEEREKAANWIVAPDILLYIKMNLLWFKSAFFEQYHFLIYKK